MHRHQKLLAILLAAALAPAPAALGQTPGTPASPPATPTTDPSALPLRPSLSLPGAAPAQQTSPVIVLPNPTDPPLSAPLAQDLAPGKVPSPSPQSTLDQLYPEPEQITPYSSSDADPSLTPKQKQEAGTVQLMPVPASELLPIGGGRLSPIRLEATFNEAISLKKVLTIALENNLPIRISKAGYDSRRFLFLGSLGRFAPDFTLTYRGQQIENTGSSTSTIFTTSSTVRYPVYQGGRILYNAMANYYTSNAFKYGYYASINDALLAAYRGYYNLLLNQTLLQIRVRSVELSRSQLKLNEQLKDAGVGTNFAVYQSRTQLALDKQALLTQQVQVRQSALELARVMNTSMAINFIPEEASVRELRLVNPQIGINELLAVTYQYRPELKQFNNLRMAANRNVQVAQANLLPTFQFFTSVTKTESSRNGSGGAGGGSTVIIPTGGSGGGGVGVSGSGGRSVSAGFDLSWTLTGMGIPDLGNTLSAQALARQSLLQSNDQYLTVVQGVRSSYLNMLTAKEQIDVAAEALVSSAEQLRLANLRVTYGQGINLELIQAQRDYVTALTNHAQAIINYNISQAQLLRDTGQISIATLTNEYPLPIGLNESGNKTQ
ncbi:MAG: TolC family protein [Candidatus Melainabacteria bacterium]|nr:TolC family protein [Candidatus Melainabacteria bacterium]